MSEAVLRPCPFCGSKDIDPDGWATTATSGPCCNTCMASAGNADQSIEQNIISWNTRAYDPVLEELRNARSILVDLEGWSPETENVKAIDAALAAVEGNG